MQEVAKVTRIGPPERLQQLMSFARDLNKLVFNIILLHFIDFSQDFILSKWHEDHKSARLKLDE